MSIEEKNPFIRDDYAGYLIHKLSRGYYRPSRCGYTFNTLEAGRYTYEQAYKECSIDPLDFRLEYAPETQSGEVLRAIFRVLRAGLYREFN